MRNTLGLEKIICLGDVGIQPTQQNGVMPQAEKLDLLFRIDPGSDR